MPASTINNLTLRTPGLDSVFPFTVDPGGTPLDGQNTLDIILGRRIQFAFKTADETLNNSAILQIDNHLVVPVEINTSYGFMAMVIINSGATPDYKYTFAFPAGTTGARSSASLHPLLGSATISIAATSVVPGAGADEMIGLTGFFQTAGTAGNFNFSWAQNTADPSDTITKIGSWMVVFKS